MLILAIGSFIQSIQNWIVSFGVSEPLALIMTAGICVSVSTVTSVGLMCLLWRYRKALLRDRDLKLDKFTAPKFPTLKILNALRIPTPKFKFDLSGFKGVGTAMAVVGVAFILAFTFVIAGTDDTPIWPEAGAAYPLPIVQGVSLDPDPENPADANQTLKINLASGVRLSSLTLNNLDMGKTNLTDCIEITRAQGNSSGWLYVDNWTATGVSAPSADFANAEIANLSLGAYVDGHTVEATLDAPISDLNIESTRGSGVFLAENSVVDRVLIVLLGDAVIGNLTMTDLDCSVGGWNIDYVKAGSFTLDNTSKFGDGDGIDTADFVVNATVKARVMTDNLVDTPITVK